MAPLSPLPVLPSLVEQAERVISAGVIHERSALAADELRGRAAQLQRRTTPGALLVIAESVLPSRSLVVHLTRSDRGEERSGFVVVDWEDLEDFAPTAAARVPEAAVYAIEDPTRGDHMRNWSPAEAQEAFVREDRTPMTVAEGVHWALQYPGVVDRNVGYMMIGTRRTKPKGFDARTPALWISNGTGRDGQERRGAPKLGWCWWNNRHTWLGFASGARRVS